MFVVETDQFLVTLLSDWSLVLDNKKHVGGIATKAGRKRGSHKVAALDGRAHMGDSALISYAQHDDGHVTSWASMR